MNFQPWHYFLSVEKDFVRTINFVDLHPSNTKTFSNEYAKLLLLIGSEVDVVAKMLCAQVAPRQRAENIADYRTILTGQFAGFHTIVIEIPRYTLEIRPWHTWDPQTLRSPDWWTAYNEVKHQRDTKFAQANQENTLAALCGLLAMLLYLYKDLPHLQPYPDLLDFGFPSFLVTESGRQLPGV